MHTLTPSAADAALNYLTDLTEPQWRIIAPYLPAPAKTGRPHRHGWRAILNAIFSLLRAGCALHLLPRDLPPWRTVYHYFH